MLVRAIIQGSMWSMGLAVVGDVSGSCESEAGQPQKIHRLEEGQCLCLIGEITCPQGKL